MEPRIRYARTDDGVRIAYWTMGEGPPLIQMPNGPFSNIDFERRWPEARRWYERLAQGRTLIRYDGRGCGLSDRDAPAITIDTMDADLRAVVQSLGLESFALMGLIDSGPPAIAYAASEPEKVSHLILWCSYAKGTEQEEAPEMAGLMALADKDWHLFTQTLAYVALGWSAGRTAEIGAEYIRECASSEVLRVAWDAAGEFDVSDLLPQVTSPTLVICKPSVRWLTMELARDLAAGIANARLETLEGVSALPWAEDVDLTLQTIDEFLDPGGKSGRTEPHTLMTSRPGDAVPSMAGSEGSGDASVRDEGLPDPIPHHGAQPPIQYVTASDAVRIAYSVYGSGPVLIHVDLPNTNIDYEWRVPETRAAREANARFLRLVRYDPRGFGMSQREIDDFSLAALVRDVEAIAGRVGGDDFNLMAVAIAVPVAIAFAARRPPGLKRLVLLEGSARGATMFDPRLLGMLGAAGDDWELASESFMRAIHGWDEDAAGRRGAAFMRQATTPQTLTSFLTDITGWDVSQDLPLIDVPTLIVNSRTTRYPGEEAGKEMAAQIPNSQLVILDGAQDERFRASMISIGRFIIGGNLPPDVEAAAAGSTPYGVAGASDAVTLKQTAASGKRFADGRYWVRRVLGGGAQKTVYLVHDEALDRDCALSLIKADALDADAVQRLRREGQAMARLGAHPNVVTVFDAGVEDSMPYLVCEYVGGGDLRDALRKAARPMPILTAVEIAIDIAEALSLAHSQGVIHRDVKPENVWLTEKGTAKLGDFGLAMASDRSRLTQAGTMMGTAAYMPPEQALGGDVDARSDLYSLGCVLYEMLAGRPPFLGDDVLAVISQHINSAPVAPSEHNLELPNPLEALIMQLLAKAPEERPQSASAVLDELKAVAMSDAETSNGG